jgi:hypothetical protein
VHQPRAGVRVPARARRRAAAVLGAAVAASVDPCGLGIARLPHGSTVEVAGILQGPSGRQTAVVSVRIILPGRRRLGRSPSSSEIAHDYPVPRVGHRRPDTRRPRGGLRAGDIGAVVQVHAADALEVEFVTAAGWTQAPSDSSPLRLSPLSASPTL